MAGAIGTAASVVGLIGALLKTIQEIQKARERVKNAPKKESSTRSPRHSKSRRRRLVLSERSPDYRRLRLSISARY
ncbi:hypothetical protein BDP67DRAFT_531415 [Colletotrichum lupini]|nr:hypothetical protein BDP67DRAFT_531415 [Colletotrichum lupini]